MSAPQQTTWGKKNHKATTPLATQSATHRHIVRIWLYTPRTPSFMHGLSQHIFERQTRPNCVDVPLDYSVDPPRLVRHFFEEIRAILYRYSSKNEWRVLLAVATNCQQRFNAITT